MKRHEYIPDNQVVKRAKAAVKLAIERKNAMGVSAIVYNRKTGEICRLNEDGTKTVIQKNSRRRYSERISTK